jgi:excisionase family DNA binding protein
MPLRSRACGALAPRGAAMIALPVPDELLDEIADRVAGLLGERESSRWLGVREAAEHLGCSRHRVYTLVSEQRIPHQHEGRRVVFDKAELDRWVRAGGAPL